MFGGIGSAFNGGLASLGLGNRAVGGGRFGGLISGALPGRYGGFGGMVRKPEAAGVMGEPIARDSSALGSALGGGTVGGMMGAPMPDGAYMGTPMGNAYGGLTGQLGMAGQMGAPLYGGLGSIGGGLGTFSGIGNFLNQRHQGFGAGGGLFGGFVNPSMRYTQQPQQQNMFAHPAAMYGQGYWGDAA